MSSSQPMLPYKTHHTHLANRHRITHLQAMVAMGNSRDLKSILHARSLQALEELMGSCPYWCINAWVGPIAELKPNNSRAPWSPLQSGIEGLPLTTPLDIQTHIQTLTHTPHTDRHIPGAWSLQYILNEISLSTLSFLSLGSWGYSTTCCYGNMMLSINKYGLQGMDSLIDDCKL